MSNLIVVTIPARSSTSVAPLQNLAAAGSLTLASPLVINGVGDAFITFPNIARTISLTSTNNLSAVTFTITGTDINGQANSVNLSGPNANTVSTSVQFHTISSITSNGAAAAVSAGTTASTSAANGTATSEWILLDGHRRYAQTTLQVVAGGGTVSYNLSQTLDAPETYRVNTSTGGTSIINTPTPFDAITGAPTLTPLTTSKLFYLTNPVTALQISTNTTNTAVLTFTILQQGVR